MLIKKEGGKPGIFTTKSKNLTGPWPQPDDHDFVSFEGKRKCEGSSAFQIAGDDGWQVGYVEYSSRPARYRICKADKYLSHFNSPHDIIGVAAPQHGSFVALTKDEYERLDNYWQQYESVVTHNPGVSCRPGDSSLRRQVLYLLHNRRIRTVGWDILHLLFVVRHEELDL